MINLCRLALGGQTVKKLSLLASKYELDQSQRKSTQVVPSRCKSTQVGGQTKRKLNASPKLASTCKFVWPGLNCFKSYFTTAKISFTFIIIYCYSYCTSTEKRSDMHHMQQENTKITGRRTIGIILCSLN